MKIAIIYGKGLDGCGVQRGGVEMTNWAVQNGHVCDSYFVDERKFHRAKFHGDTADYIGMTPENFIDHASKINNDYDIVILNSYPSIKHESHTIMSFYNNFVKKLDKPIIVGMMHEISKNNIDRIPILFLILNWCDIVMNFSTKTFFSTSFSKLFPSKVLGERTRRFKLWTDISELQKTGDKYKSDKQKRLTYMGRWTTMKDPRRILDMTPHFRQKDSSFDTLIIGIEKSIGARVDILDHPLCEFYTYCVYPPKVLQDPTKTVTMGPYKYDQGMRIMAESMFGASFYRLLKDKNNYGDRMEYTQIEMIGLGTIPVFDIDYGKSFNSIDSLAVWSDREDLGETVDTILDIAGNPVKQKQYQEAGLNFVSSEFDSSVVLPTMFDGILKTGKDYNKFDSDLDVLYNVYNNKDLANYANDILKDQPIPLGFSEIGLKTVNVFKSESSRARVPSEFKAPILDLSAFF